LQRSDVNADAIVIRKWYLLDLQCGRQCSDQKDVKRYSLNMASASQLLIRLASRMRLKPGSGHLPILMYHRVLQQFDAMQPDVMTAAQFDVQMQLLVSAFTVLPLHEAVPALHAGKLPARAVCITFDDGYLDNFDVALPILQRHGLSATFFVASGYLDGDCMFNDVVVEALRHAPAGAVDLSHLQLGTRHLNGVASRAQVAEEMVSVVKYMDAQERDAFCSALPASLGIKPVRNLMMHSEHVHGMVKAGMSVGGHSVTHPILTKITDAQAAQEISGNWAALKDITGVAPVAFAYPNGKPGTDFAPRHAQIVKQAGYRYAVSTAVGTAGLQDPLFSLPRFCLYGQSQLEMGLRLLRMTYFQHQPYPVNA
jgi:peptidoglycan/xylan/chitin deacetylase (PgdA/CDA1 family)